MIAMNLERMLKLFRDMAEQGREQKRLLFKEHEKALVLQNAFRKHTIRKKIQNKLTPKQRTALRNVILNFRVRFKIKRKAKAVRLIELHVFRQKLIKLFRSKLFIMNNGVKKYYLRMNIAYR
jgi:hypothetical protein